MRDLRHCNFRKRQRRIAPRGDRRQQAGAVKDRVVSADMRVFPPHRSEPAVINIQSYAASHANLHALKTGTSSGAGQGKTLSDSTQALSTLQNSALNSLAREIPGMDASAVRNLDASEYTPEKIADRIGKFVALGLENARSQGKSEEEVQSLYDSAMKGVEQGFKEAKEILKNLDLLGGGIGEQVKATEDATFAALEKLSPAKQSPAVAETGTVGLAVAQRYRRADDFELNLQTRDGDTVKISFSRDFAAEESAALAMDGEGNRVSLSDVSYSENTGYLFKTEGKLSDEELDAIQELVADVSKVARDFFGGDVQQAFEQAPNIAFDQTQLSSMSLRMSRTEQYSAAAQYRQNQQLENPEQAQAGRLLGHLAHDMRDSFQTPALEFLTQAREAADQILRGLTEQDSRYQDASTEQQASYRGNLERLLNAVQSPATAVAEPAAAE